MDITIGSVVSFNITHIFKWQLCMFFKKSMFAPEITLMKFYKKISPCATVLHFLYTVADSNAR